MEIPILTLKTFFLEIDLNKQFYKLNEIIYRNIRIIKWLQKWGICNQSSEHEWNIRMKSIDIANISKLQCTKVGSSFNVQNTKRAMVSCAYTFIP